MLLQQATKWFDVGKEPRVNEVVVPEGPQKNRMLWNLARIKELHRGRDGLVRSVTLKANDNLIRRDIRSVYRLPEANEQLEKVQREAEGPPPEPDE